MLKIQLYSFEERLPEQMETKCLIYKENEAEYIVAEVTIRYYFYEDKEGFVDVYDYPENIRKELEDFLDDCNKKIKKDVNTPIVFNDEIEALPSIFINGIELGYNDYPNVYWHEID